MDAGPRPSQTPRAAPSALAAAEARRAALEREIARRRQAADAQRRQADTLRGLLNHLAATPRVESAVDHVLATIGTELEAPVVALWLADSEGRLRCRQSIDREPARQVPVPAHGCRLAEAPLVASLLHARVPVTLGPERFAELRPLVDPAWLAARRASFVLLGPMALPPGVVGLYLAVRVSSRPFETGDRQLAAALAQHLSLAVALGRQAQAAGRALLANHFVDIVGEAVSALELLPSAPLESEARLREALARARSALARTRRAAWSLRPDVLDYRDLGVALARLADRAATGGGAAVRGRVDGVAWPLGDEVAATLFRIADEALAYEPHLATLQVSDDGHGFDPAMARGRGRYGMASMLERTSRIGGALRIDTASGAGTTVVATVPRQSPA